MNLWTLTYINWLRQEPCLHAMSQAYRDDGLLVIDELLAEARNVEARDAASRDQIAREQVRVNDHLR